MCYVIIKVFNHPILIKILQNAMGQPKRRRVSPALGDLATHRIKFNK